MISLKEKIVSGCRVGVMSEGCSAVPKLRTSTTQSQRNVEAIYKLRELESAGLKAEAERQRQAIIVMNMGLVRQVVNKISKNPDGRGHIDRDDLVQEGVFGLYRALEKFDEGHGATFASYASLWIRSKVGHAFKKTNIVHVPEHRWEAVRSLSLDAPVFDDGNETFLDRLAPEPQDELIEGLSFDFDSELLRIALAQLEERKRRVIEMRYFEGIKLEEVGKILGITRERARQLQIRAVTELKKLLIRGTREDQVQAIPERSMPKDIPPPNLIVEDEFRLKYQQNSRTFKLAEMFPNARDSDPGLYPNQDVACAYLENVRWPNGVVCPHCDKIENITHRKNKYYRCNVCKQDFTVRTGTIFERSHVPLHKWIHAIHQVLTKDTKIVSVKLADELDVTQKTAWKMLNRIRGIVDINDSRTLRTVMPRSKFVKIYPEVGQQCIVDNYVSPMVASCRLLKEKTGIDVDRVVRCFGTDREDAIQEIWMTVLENDLGLQIDADQIRNAVKRSRIGALDRWKTISIYAPIRGTDDLRLIDTLQSSGEA